MLDAGDGTHRDLARLRCPGVVVVLLIFIYLPSYLFPQGLLNISTYGAAGLQQAVSGWFCQPELKQVLEYTPFSPGHRT